jgi:hypothetical protein
MAQNAQQHPLTVRNSMNRHKRFFILRPGKRLSGDSGRHQMVHKQLHLFRLFRRKLLRSVNVYFRQACRKYTEFVGEGGNPERVLADSKSDRSIEHLIDPSAGPTERLHLLAEGRLFQVISVR